MKISHVGTESLGDSTYPGSTPAYVPDVARATPVGLDQGQEVWVACDSGYPANLATSVLECAASAPLFSMGRGCPRC